MGGAGADFTDEALVAATRAGDDGAFERLYRRYQRRIAAYVHGMVNDHGRAEDITQEVFMSALRRMRETDRAIIFKPWIYEIAKNACIDAFRRSRRTEEVSYDAEDGLGSSDHGRLVSRSPTPDMAVDTRMSLDHLRGAFGGLSEMHHDILVMRELEGLSYREIGQRLGMSRPSVESTLFRARRRLAEEYEELTSGERCRSIQVLIADSAGRRLGIRHERKMGRHLSYCQPCRRAAFAAGLDVAALAAHKSLGAKVAALLPLPAFAKRKWLGLGGDSGAAGGSGTTGGSSALSNLAAGVSQCAEPLAGGWAKTAALVTSVALAGVGAGVVTTRGDSAQSSSVPPPISEPAAGSGGTGAAGAHAAGSGGVRTVSRTGAAVRRSRSTATSATRGATSAGGRPPAVAGGGSTGAATAPVGGSRPAAGVAPDLGRGGSTVGGTLDKLAPKPSAGVPGASVPGVSAPQVTAPRVPSVNTGSRTVNGVTKTVGGAVSTVTTTVTGTVNKVTSTGTGAVNTVTSTATGTVNRVAPAVTKTVGSVVGTAPAAVSTKAAPTAAGTQAPTPPPAVTQATTAVPQVTTAVPRVVSQATNSVPPAVTHATSTAATTVQPVTGAVHTAVPAAPAVPAVTDAVNSVTTAAPHTGSPVSVPTVTGAPGGILPGH